MRLLIVLIAAGLLLTAGSCANSWRIENAHPPAGEFIMVDGERLHYQILGPTNAPGPVIVLIHGASANHLDMTMSLGEPLSKQYRVIAFDRPGRGYSTRPADGYELATQARLLRNAAKQLGIERPVVVGQSFGGAVALRWALDFPDDISGLVLLASVSHDWPGGVAWYNHASGTPVLGAILRRTLIPAYGNLVAPGSIDEAFWPGKAPGDYFNRSGLGLLFRPKTFKNNAADIANLEPQIEDQSKRYGEIAVPTRIMTGTHDTTVSPTIHSYALAQQIPNSKLTFLPEAGHGLHHTHTEPITDEIRSLMTELIVKNSESTRPVQTISPDAPQDPNNADGDTDVNVPEEPSEGSLQTPADGAKEESNQKP